ncbi:NAD(P)H-dependent oxidoreductase [Ancylobacter sp. 6x-1]|uniref:NAD(P)H-dependent oxidoreductase n=1 Tax=Ancylobacter crimeensis TaxID=2579147 RepID=A0ABT0DFG5_9HYPH|nr:NAD(P)H-dependent oxidoreductase [Ancylobacter crimeensis]MCK0198716.1 NAD(P)H-dependent oxidoreductase [Ancylobacter crimeensis]
MPGINIVGLSGGLSTPSRTLSLVQLATRRISEAALRRGLEAQSRIVDIAALSGIGLLRDRAGAGPEEEAALRAVETADLLVVGSPVYKGSYSGLFKHFVDLLDYRGLDGVPVALLATGGSDRHALVIEHQLRPLFAFFQAQPLGTGIFFTEREFKDGLIAEGAPAQRFERLVREAGQALAGRITEPERIIEAA